MLKQINLEGVPASKKRVEVYEADTGIFEVYEEDNEVPCMTIARSDIDIEILRNDFFEHYHSVMMRN